MSPLARRAAWLRRVIDARRRRYLRELDNESVAGYQRGYYPVIMLAGLYLAIGADEPTRALADTLGAPSYHAWLLLHFICPPIALYGRYVYDQTDLATRQKFGARLQLIGDGGLWAAICIYVACLLNTSYWGSAIYPSFYLLMGVPGGFRFTLRSWRRLQQANQRAREL